MLKRILAFFFGVIFTLILLEGTMRASARKDGLTQKLEDFQKGGDQVVRIITLGESTSAEYWVNDKDVSWPAVLERKLNARPAERRANKDIKVLNLARSGTSSTFLVDHLETVLQFAKPDFVVSMMGVNDSYTLRPNKSWLFQKSYLARFVYWAWIDFHCEGCYKIDHRMELDDLVAQWPEATSKLPFLNTAPTELTLDELKQAEIEFEALKSNHAEDQSELDIIWGTWLYALSELPIYAAEDPSKIGEFESFHPVRKHALQRAKAAFERAQPQVLKLKGSLKQHCFVLSRTRELSQCIDLIFKGLENGVPLTPDLMNLALTLGGDDPKVQKLADIGGYERLAFDRALIGTRSAYQRLDQLALKHGFHWIAMQYPMGAVAGLDVFFDELTDQEFQQKHMTFDRLFTMQERPVAELRQASHRSYVSNIGFQELVANGRISDYFIDLFARTRGMNFGHTNEKGHELIAENALTAIERKLNVVSE